MSRQFVVKLADFDTSLLPLGARTPGTPEFTEAVVQQLTRASAKQRLTALVTLDDEFIHIAEYASASEALNDILPLLRSRQLPAAIEKLEGLVKVHPAEPNVLYNLGIAYSELGQFDEAIIRLKRCTQAQPKMAHAWVGIGTAYERMGKLELALEALERAVKLEPKDGYANRNLGAVLGQLGRHRQAVPHMRRAYAALPDDPQSLYGLALTLHRVSEEPQLEEEADGLFARFIARYPQHPLAEEARTLRTAFAHKRLMRQGAVAGMRPDVLFYVMGALEKFATHGEAWRQAVTFEIALLGRQGLDINDSTEKYEVRNLPGKFSGLHLLAIMYTGFKQMDPGMDAGVDFSQEYEMALSLHTARQRNTGGPASASRA